MNGGSRLRNRVPRTVRLRAEHPTCRAMTAGDATKREVMAFEVKHAAVATDGADDRAQVTQEVNEDHHGRGWGGVSRRRSPVRSSPISRACAILASSV